MQNQSKKNYHIIFHIDMNCFYASCEMTKNPSLKGKPIVISRNDNSRKSIILSPSYEARKYGIKSAMILQEAFNLCKNLIVVNPHGELYQEYSKMFFEYLHTITEKVEPASIDEGYMDVTDVCEKIPAETLAKNIQDHLLNTFNLPCSIGIAPNKFLAKMASDMKKPLGITVLRKREINKYLWPLPIDDMFGVGKKTAPKLKEIGVKTIGDLANYKNMEYLKMIIGNANAEGLVYRANGNDNSEVNYESFDKVSSISNSYTFETDVFQLSQIKATFKVITNTACFRLNEMKMKAYNIGIQIKYSDFHQINRSKGVAEALSEETEIWKIVNNLIEEYYDEGVPIRLVGVFLNRLIETKDEVRQLTIFDDLDTIEKENEINKLLNNINKELGTNLISKGIKEKK